MSIISEDDKLQFICNVTGELSSSDNVVDGFSEDKNEIQLAQTSESSRAYELVNNRCFTSLTPEINAEESKVDDSLQSSYNDHESFVGDLISFTTASSVHIADSVRPSSTLSVLGDHAKNGCVVEAPSLQTKVSDLPKKTLLPVIDNLVFGKNLPNINDPDVQKPVVETVSNLILLTALTTTTNPATDKYVELASRNTVVDIANKDNPQKLNRKNSSSKMALKAVATSTPILSPPSKKMKQASQIKMTIPVYANIPHGHKSLKQNLTSEDMELAKIEELRTAAKKKKEEGRKLLKKLQAQTSQCKPEEVTKPKEFHFRTDERVAKTHSMVTRSDTSSTSADFALEQKKLIHPVQKSKTTVIKPFSFSNVRKRKHEVDTADSDQFLSMAKAISDFHNRTPRRFKSSYKNNKPKGYSKPLRTTVPKTPSLSKTKSRPLSTMSAEEKEAKELEEIKSYKFKAQPVNPAVFNPPKPAQIVKRKTPTVPEEFHLSGGHSSTHTVNTSSVHEFEKTKPFKAQPVPTSVLQPPTLAKKEPALMTVPMSPAFALKERVRQRTFVDNKPSETQKFYHPVPNQSKVFVPVLESHKTKPQPFSFDGRDRERLLKKEEKLKEIRENSDNAAQFKAQLMPIPHTPILPPKHVKKTTEVQPFEHHADERIASRTEAWLSKLEVENQTMKELASFQANKDYEKITKGKPWVPKLQYKPKTVPLNVLLHSDKRAKERDEYQSRLKEELAEKQNVLVDDGKLKEMLEQEKITQLRKDLVHKAQDIHSYRGVQVKKSDKPLTVPQSPNFSTRFNK